MNNDPLPAPSVTQSLDRAMRLLELVVMHSQTGVDLQALVGSSGLKKPTAHRLLMGLRKAGLLDYDSQSRRYVPSYKLYEMGLKAGVRFDVRLLSLPSLVRLAEETCDTVHLSVRQGDVSICVAREIGSYPIRTLTLEVGDARPLGLGAGSLALLAALPDDEIEAIIKRNRDSFSSYPLYSPDFLREQVAMTRKNGYARNDGHMLAEMAALAVAVREPRGTVCAALSIAAIRSRLTQPRLDSVVSAMKREALRIEKEFAQRQA